MVVFMPVLGVLHDTSMGELEASMGELEAKGTRVWSNSHMAHGPLIVYC